MNSDEIYDQYYRYEGNDIHHTAIIYPNVIMGKGNKIGPYCVIGSNGEIRGCDDFYGNVIIGDNNIISEFVSIQRPKDEGKSTKIGDNNIIMAHSHIGHDAEIGNDCEISTHSVVGGYVKIGNNTKIKLNTTIRNRKTIGDNTIVGMGSVVVKDIGDNMIIVGNPAKPLIK
jgi:UDP-N-acetylglucosamine acyltransferase